MVTVDMSTARAQITRRKRRMRRAAQRRLRRQRLAHLRELRAADAAKRARQKAVDAWAAEEARLSALRAREHTPRPRVPPAGRRAVTFADQVLVTEIPAAEGCSLPTPVTSPIGVSICAADDNSDDDDHCSVNPLFFVPKSRFPCLADAVFADDDDDPEFQPDQPAIFPRGTTLVDRPRRRIVAERLSSPANAPNSRTPSGPQQDTKMPEANGSPKRRRSKAAVPPSDQPSTPPNRTSHDGEAPNAPHSRPGHETKLASRSPLASPPSSPNASKQKKRKLAQTTASPDSSPNRHKTSCTTKDAAHDVAANRAVETGSPPEPVASSKGKATKRKHSSPNHPAQASAQSPNSTPKKRKMATYAQNQGASPADLSKEQDISDCAAGMNGHSTNGTAAHDCGKISTNGHANHGVNEDTELDNMFCDLVRQRAANRAEREKKKVLGPQEELGDGNKQGKRMKNGKIVKPKNGPTRYTEDGLRIVSYQEIAADQPPGLNGECPFDCSCCF